MSVIIETAVWMTRRPASRQTISSVVAVGAIGVIGRTLKRRLPNLSELLTGMHDDYVKPTCSTVERRELLTDIAVVWCCLTPLAIGASIALAAGGQALGGALGYRAGMLLGVPLSVMCGFMPALLYYQSLIAGRRYLPFTRRAGSGSLGRGSTVALTVVIVLAIVTVLW